MLRLKWDISGKFEEYLYGSTFVVWTDNALSHLQTANLEQQINDGLLISAPMTSLYRSGRENRNADELSRQTPRETDDVVEEDHPPEQPAKPVFFSVDHWLRQCCHLFAHLVPSL